MNNLFTILDLKILEFGYDESGDGILEYSLVTVWIGLALIAGVQGVASEVISTVTDIVKLFFNPTSL